MAGQFRVEPAGLNAAGTRLSACAETLSTIDLPGPLGRAADATSGSSVAGQAGVLGAELASAMQALRAAVSQMSGSVRASAGNYTGADAAISQGFAGPNVQGGSW